MDAYLRYRLTYQLVLVFTWVLFGWLRLTISVATPDLREKLGVDYEQVTRILFAESGGFFIGSLLGGVLFNRYLARTEVIMAAGISCGALGMFMLPFQQTLFSLAVCLFMFGASMGMTNIGGNTKVLHLWGEDAGSPMHSLHCGYGLGSIIAPQVVKLYMSKKTLVQSTEHPGKMIEVVTESARLIPRFCGAAIVYFIMALLLLYLYTQGPPQGFQLRVASNTKQGAPTESPNSRRTLHVLLFLFFVQMVGSETGFDRFILPYVIESPGLHMTKSDATFLLSVYWLFFTAGRGASVVIVRWLKPHQMIAVQIAGVLCAACFLAIGGSTHAGTLWLGVCLFGLNISPLFAGTLAWGNLVMHMSSVSVMVCLVGSSCGSMFYVYMAGYLFQYAGPGAIMYMQVGVLTALAGVFAAMEHVRRHYVKM